MDEEERRQHEILVKNQELAEAKGRRIYYEHYRKVHKALLMKQYESKYPTAAAQEREAYADPDYLKTLNELEHWTARAELLSLERADLEHRFEAWRTRQANQRAERGRYGA
jgi:hypothetical protein